jgi:hypothetical protein
MASINIALVFLERRGYAARALIPALRRAIARAASNEDRPRLLRAIFYIDPAEIIRYKSLLGDLISEDGNIEPWLKEQLHKAVDLHPDFWATLVPCALAIFSGPDFYDPVQEPSFQLLRELKPSPRRMIPMLLEHIRNDTYPLRALQLLAGYDAIHYRAYGSSSRTTRNTSRIAASFSLDLSTGVVPVSNS